MDPQLFEQNPDYQFNDNPVYAKDFLGKPTDPLALEISDEQLIKIIDKKIETDKKFWTNKYNLAARRKRMEMALFGKMVQQAERANELKRYETRYSNNALYEIEATLKPVAMSKLPDMLVTPGTDNPDALKSAEDVSEAINDDLKKRKNREVLGLGFKHLPVYFTACVKARWNPELGEDGDYEFVNIHPDRIVLDSTANNKDQKRMRTISELVRLTVQDVVMRFPDAREKLFKKLHEQGLVVGEGDFAEEDMATEIDIWEVWFTWYKQVNAQSDQPSEVNIVGKKYERVEGVMWKYETVLLKKMKNPTYDYQGEERWFVYDDPSNENSKRNLQEGELLQRMLANDPMQGITKEKVYFNYFNEPQKPYYFFGYDQWGKVAIDETSRIEQNFYNQENLNTLGKQILDTIRNRTKHIWSTDSGLKANDIQNIDMANPATQLLIDGNVNETHKSVEPERPDSAQFNALNEAKNDMFGLAGATALTGVMQSKTATTNQIAREQNFTRVDDVVEDTINACSEWMANWALQFIKLRYTEEHFRKLIGNQGQVTFLKLKRDSIDDGMEVMIKASSSDKAKAQKNAMDAASLGAPFVNPLDFFKDMEYSDPEGRTQRGMMFATDPAGYALKYGMGIDGVNAQVNTLLGSQGGAEVGAQPPTTPQSTQTTPQSTQTTPQSPPQSAQQLPSAENPAVVPTRPVGLPNSTRGT